MHRGWRYRGRVRVRLFATPVALGLYVLDSVPRRARPPGAVAADGDVETLKVPGMSSDVTTDMLSGLATLTTSRLPVFSVTLLPPGASPAR